MPPTDEQPIPDASNPRDSHDVTGRRRWGGFALLALLLIAGFVLERSGVFDWRSAVALAQSYGDRWWLAPVLALVTAALYALTLPGSAMMIVTGILLPPLTAAIAFVSGGIAGAYGAFTLARLAAATGKGGRKGKTGRLFEILARKSSFATLLAVRVAPGFPHSAINVAAGLLNLPLGRFLASTALGLAIKGTLFILAVHEASHAATLEEAISWRTFAPLAALSLLLLIAPPLLRRLRGSRSASGESEAE